MKAVSERAPLHPGTWFALIAGAALVGVFGGLLMHSQLAPPEVREPVAGDTAMAAPDPRLIEALNQLAEELRASRANLPQLETPSGPSTQRIVASESAADHSVELAAAMRELRETIYDLRLGRSRSSTSALTLPPGDRRGWLPELPPGTENPWSAYNRQHMLWSEQQILDAYGLPTRITAEGPGVSRWYYYKDGTSVHFQVNFQDGRVTQLDSFQ